MMSKPHPATRHVISINDLSDKDIDTIFDTAQAYLDQLPDGHFSYRIGRSTNVASNFILASLFYEPSTRTRTRLLRRRCVPGIATSRAVRSPTCFAPPSASSRRSTFWIHAGVSLTCAAVTAPQPPRRDAAARR